LTGPPQFVLVPDMTFAGPGLRVQQVPPGTLAQNTGLKPGDVLTRLDDVEIKTMADARKVGLTKIPGMKKGDRIRGEQGNGDRSNYKIPVAGYWTSPLILFREVASQVWLVKNPRNVRGPKKPQPKKSSGRKNLHVSSARLLNKQNQQTITLEWMSLFQVGAGFELLWRVHRQDPHSRPANGRPSVDDDPPTGKMFGPGVLPRVEQSDELTCLGVEARYVRPLVKIAMVAGEGEVTRVIRTVMLLRRDVFNVEGRERNG